MSKPSFNVILRLLEREQVEQVWRKGMVTVFGDPALVRLDEQGNIIQRDKYGDRKSLFGWEIDHIVPKECGGSDHVSNLRPLRCRANARLADHWIRYAEETI
jgi:hypothetical protein